MEDPAGSKQKEIWYFAVLGRKGTLVVANTYILAWWQKAILAE
jgi:hypothetical protein